MTMANAVLFLMIALAPILAPPQADLIAQADALFASRDTNENLNRAASLMERMELEGIVGQANHAGKREILVEEEESGF